MQCKENSEQQANKKMTKLDFETGDVVRISGTPSKYNGEIGTIIGVRLVTGRSGQPVFAYTVKLSDALAKEVDATKIVLVEQEN